MVELTPQELEKLATLSALVLDEQEKMAFPAHLQTLLEYASQLDEVKARQVVDATKQNINVFRDDRVAPCDAEAILDQAPKREETFFVVPKIL